MKDTYPKQYLYRQVVRAKLFIDANFADAIDLVLHLARHRGARVVEELIKVERYDASSDRYEKTVLFDGCGAAGSSAASA